MLSPKLLYNVVSDPHIGLIDGFGVGKRKKSLVSDPK